MKYKTIEIKPSYTTREWQVFFREDDIDRRGGKTYPHPIGFYHFPETISLNKAFLKLKECMVKRHKDEIAKLEKSLKELEKVELPKSLIAKKGKNEQKS